MIIKEIHAHPTDAEIYCIYIDDRDYKKCIEYIFEEALLVNTDLYSLSYLYYSSITARETIRDLIEYADGFTAKHDLIDLGSTEKMHIIVINHDNTVDSIHQAITSSVHETSHLVDSMFRYMGIKDETEFRAYMQEYIYSQVVELFTQSISICAYGIHMPCDYPCKLPCAACGNIIDDLNNRHITGHLHSYCLSQKKTSPFQANRGS